MAQKVKESLSLTWDVEEYSLPVKNTNPETKKQQKKVQKTVISKVKGQAKGGDFIAIMGPSGAGKTTLLNILSDRVELKKGSSLKKAIKINEEELRGKNFGDHAAYVMQDDRLFATLTAKECIEFAVNMKLNTSPDEKQKKVDEILADLGLIKCADTIVGNAKMKGVSGGERKRISIAVELITDPDVIFLDEPTSGLDTVTAYRICKLLKKMADQGKIVICTIHQPTAEAFFLFNKLVLLAKGRLMYQGLTKDSVGYFSKAGFECPAFLNPIEYFMKIVQPKGDEQEANKQHLKLVDYYEQSHSESSEPNPVHVQHANSEQVKNTIEVPALSKLYYLTKRAVHNVKRNRPLIMTRVMTTLIFGLLGLMIWFDSDDSYKGIGDKMGVFQFIGINQFMMSVQSVVLSFPQERDVFLKEYSGRLYGAVPYFFAKNIPEIPFEIIFPVIFSSILYHGIGFRDSGEHFIWFIIIVFLTAMSGTSFGFMLSCAINDVEIVSSLGTISLMPFILTAGFLANVEDLGWWISWIQYISPLRYSLEGLVRNEFEDRTGLCSERPQGCDPIEQYGFDFGFSTCVLVLLIMSVSYRVIALIALKVKARKIGQTGISAPP